MIEAAQGTALSFRIVITIKGVISHTGVNYQHVTELKTWN